MLGASFHAEAKYLSFTNDPPVLTSFNPQYYNKNNLEITGQIFVTLISNTMIS